ncbi:hypothetical protein BH23BAC4_BH23BAC4_11090 [soil metagenome]
MGQALLLAVAAAAIFGMLSIVGGSGKSATRAAATVTEHHERFLSREIALSGHAYASTAVLANHMVNGSYIGPNHYEGEYEGGTYRSEVTVVGQSITIVTRAQRPTTSYVVRATYAPNGGEGPQEKSVPSFLRHAILANSNLTITGTSRVLGAPGINADIHANGALSVGGNSLIQGFGTYSSGGSSNISLNNLDPQSNPDNAPKASHAPTVDIPPFNAVDHRPNATRVFNGNLNLSTAILGTRDNPEVWYVAGDLTLGSGLLTGYGVFLVQGNISVSGQSQSAGAIRNESNLGFYATGNVSVNAGARLSGQIFANGTSQFAGNATLYGSLTARGAATLSGGFAVHFRPASSALTSTIWPDEGSNGELGLVAYREGG